MKKLLSFFLIAFILTNFFLPLGLALNQDSLTWIKRAEAVGCTVTSAVWNPAGDQATDFFVEKKTTATIIVKTSGCTVGSIIDLYVSEADTNIITNDNLVSSGLSPVTLNIPADNFTILIQLGEEECESRLTGAIGYDCDLYFSFKQNQTVLYSSLGKTKGDLFYECSGVCNTDASFLSITNNGTNDVPINLDSQTPTVLSNDYTLLVPVGTLTKAPNNIGEYFNIIFLIAIGVCAVLAVIMIVIGGIQYMGDESIFGKTEAKSKITAAILGLLIALGAYALLNTLNPALLGKDGINISQASADTGGDTNAPIGGVNSLPTGIICGGGKINIPNIVNSFKDKMTYEMGAKGTPGPNNTIKLDCSGFVNYVLLCAGVPFTNGGTANIFSGAEKVTSLQGDLINNKTLAIGDLVGWIAGENKEKYGHVMIYIGGGQVQVGDSHGGTAIGKALGIFPVSTYQSRIKYIKRAQ